MQGLGQFAAGLLGLITAAGFKESLSTAQTVAECDGVCGLAMDKMWRTIIGFGAVPGCIALYYRLTIPETPRYTFDVARDVEQGGEDVRAYLTGQRGGHPDELQRVETLRNASIQLDPPIGSFTDFFGHFGQWKHGKILLGTASSWFMLDVAFYGLGLNNTVILQEIGYSGKGNVYDLFYQTAVGNIILVCAGAIPGYWVTVATIDHIGRKPIQIGGFFILTILFLIIGFAYNSLGTGGLLTLYVLCNFFFNLYVWNS
jgi:PHS family inorganic phosphate transporter-like MFS transporter